MIYKVNVCFPNDVVQIVKTNNRTVNASIGKVKDTVKSMSNTCEKIVRSLVEFAVIKYKLIY